METGSFTFWARTTAVAMTLPSHTSMLTGVTVNKHLIEWNRDLPLRNSVYPAFPTLFEAAKSHGYTTAMVAGKSKFNILEKPGTLDWSWITTDSATEDPDVAAHAIAIINDHTPQVMFVHFPSVDNAGHAKGWGSVEQLATAERADAALGAVLAALDEVKLRDQTLVILTADHGGAGRYHGADDERSRHIPWIVAGPGVRRNFDLTLVSELTVNTYDTFATACFVMKIPLDKRLDGKPLTQIFEIGELIQPATKETMR